MMNDSNVLRERFLASREEILEQGMMQHFYTPDELEAFLNEEAPEFLYDCVDMARRANKIRKVYFTRQSQVGIPLEEMEYTCVMIDIFSQIVQGNHPLSLLFEIQAMLEDSCKKSVNVNVLAD